VTAAVAFAAVSATGNDGPDTIVPAAMLERIARWRDSFAPMVAAMPLRSFDLSAVTAPRYAPTKAVSSAWPSLPMLFPLANVPDGYVNLRPLGAADFRTPASAL
jgi:hypothetical protein